LFLDRLAVSTTAAVFLQHLAVVLQVRGNADSRQTAAQDPDGQCSPHLSLLVIRILWDFL
jgi:hypothetical protein